MRRVPGRVAWIASALVVVLAATAYAEDAAPERLHGVDPKSLTTTYAPGVFEPEYEPPPPGSYTLPVIKRVRDHPVIDADGTATTLFALTGERIAVVAFIYTTCVEAVGCPMSHAVLHQLDRALVAEPSLQERVALVTLSFDPERDTPARMAEQRTLHAPRSTWRFATTGGGGELEALLDDFDQPVAKLRFEDGAWSGLFRHVLKVFLVDPDHQVRAIYSAGFLNQALVLNDLKTLVAR